MNENENEDITQEDLISAALNVFGMLKGLTVLLNEQGNEEWAKLFQPTLDEVDSLPGKIAAHFGDDTLQTHYRVGRPSYGEDDQADNEEVLIPCEVSGELIWASNDEKIAEFKEQYPSTFNVSRISMIAAVKELGFTLAAVGAHDVLSYYADQKLDGEMYEKNVKVITAQTDKDAEHMVRGSKYVFERFVEEGVLTEDDLEKFTTKKLLGSKLDRMSAMQALGGMEGQQIMQEAIANTAEDLDLSADLVEEVATAAGIIDTTPPKKKTIDLGTPPQ